MLIILCCTRDGDSGILAVLCLHKTGKSTESSVLPPGQYQGFKLYLTIENPHPPTTVNFKGLNELKSGRVAELLHFKRGVGLDDRLMLLVKDDFAKSYRYSGSPTGDGNVCVVVVDFNSSQGIVVGNVLTGFGVVELGRGGWPVVFHGCPFVEERWCGFE